MVRYLGPGSLIWVIPVSVIAVTKRDMALKALVGVGVWACGMEGA